MATNAQNNSSSINNSVHTQSQVYSEGMLTIKGYWINNGPSVLNSVNVSALKNEGVTDLFISTNKNDVKGSLVPFLNKFNNSGIRIHAWITCFKNGTKWYDPGTNPDLVNNLLNSIKSISSNYNISGIHLDSVRYPGTAYKYKGTKHVTDFTQDVYNILQDINKQNISNKNKILLSAALMPETNTNSYYYGQDYGALAPYLDFLVPMIYKGNYQSGTSWIGATTRYIVLAADGKPVVAGLQTYRSDDYPIPISSSELDTDIQAAIDNGSSGYVLFKYGLTDTGISGVPFYSHTDQDDIFKAAALIKTYIEKNESLPSKVSLNSSLADYVDMPTFLYLLSKSIVYLDAGKTATSLRVIDYNNPASLLETVEIGSLNKNEYLDIAGSILNYMDLKGYPPTYRNSSIGKVPYQNLIYTYSKIVSYYKLNGLIPSSASIKPLIWPNVKKIEPTNNAAQIPISYPITITFDENIKAGTNFSGIYLKNMATGGKISITKTISGNTLVIRSSKLYYTVYKFFLPSDAVKNSAGNGLINAYSLIFTTIKQTSTPVVSKTNPNNNATGVSRTTPITITFSGNIYAATNFSGIYIKNLNTGKIVSLASKTIKGKTITIKMTYSRLSRNNYLVYLPASSVKDISGNLLKKAYSFKFKTA